MCEFWRIEYEKCKHEPYTHQDWKYNPCEEEGKCSGWKYQGVRIFFTRPCPMCAEDEEMEENAEIEECFEDEEMEENSKAEEGFDDEDVLSQEVQERLKIEER
ncbi:hypothetical protein BDZ45DRAFT_692035 [Acephala macrosclerotiorum]|nr:hypothetical protein BDZ45DRAFT_692035 [Acephala macrosclerotiorum]